MGVRITEIIKDTIFPLTCIECRRDGILWCVECRADFVCNYRQRCPYCKQDTAYGAACMRHVARPLDGLLSVSWYADRRVNTLVGLWKYEGIKEGGRCIEGLVGKWTFGGSTVPPGDWVVVPVPLHPRKERERGFDQAVEISRYVSGALGHSLRLDVLERAKYSHRTQAQLDERKRRTRNLSQVYRVNKECIQVPKYVLLVDDVYTTGATMHAAAKVLKDSGVEVVWGVAFARGR